LGVKVQDHSEYFNEQYMALGELSREPGDQALLRRLELIMEAMRKAAQ
jgi:hypothetical protein